MNKNLPAAELIIRPCTFNDIPSVQEIAAKTWPITYTEVIGEDQVNYMLGLLYSSNALEEQMKNNHYFFLALREFEPVGFASFSHVEKEIFKLQKLYVLPQEQKQGTGQTLLQTVETVAKSMGAVRLRLNVNRKNRAKFYYEKKGFKIIREEDIDIGGGFFMNDYVMEKEL